MARENTQTASAKSPDFIGYDVHTKGDKTYWNRVGAAWLHHDGIGMSLQLESVPVNGRVVLRAPREEQATG
jgi:hypothetical protein